MYFQNLEIIKNLDGNFPDKIVDDLDLWLATRRDAVKDNINPSHFSEYADIDLDLVLELFFLCSMPKINILQERYDVLIYQENILIDSYYDENDIPTSVINPNTEKEYILNSTEDIRLYFELIQEPTTKPTFNTNSTGKDYGVGLDQARAAKNRAKFTLAKIL